MQTSLFQGTSTYNIIFQNVNEPYVKTHCLHRQHCERIDN
jgi:hypothetical protein